MLCFLEIIQLMVEEINRSYHQYLDNKGQSPLPHMIIQEIYSSLAIIVQVGHDQKDIL